MFTEQILSELDATLEQLICNAKTLQIADHSKLSETELDAFQKTQESLLHHLMYMDDLFAKNIKQKKILNKTTVTYKIQEKALLFKKLNEASTLTIRNKAPKRALAIKRRSKRWLRAL